MINRIIRVLLSLVLVCAVLTGAWLGWQRHQVESASKTVELAMDLNDLRTLSSISNYPLDKLLNEIKDRGIVSIGVREETLPEANTMGELYFVSGSGILRSPNINPTLSNLAKRKLISDKFTYIYCANETTRKRIQNEFHLIVPPKHFKNIGKSVFAVTENDILLRDAGVGISEATDKYLVKKGFRIIPRLWNDPRYEVVGKINLLKAYDTVIFDGDEIMGYPDNIALMGHAMKNAGMKFGNVEIVKQDGDKQLLRIMNRDIVRVHSIPNDELKKIEKDEAVLRFVRAAKERGIRLIYVRPFMPPKISEDPIKYNLNYLSEIKKGLSSNGFAFGKASAPKDLDPLGWQIMLLGVGVVIGLLLLINYFIYIPAWLMLLLTIASTFVMVIVGAGGPLYNLEKYLAFIAATVFPAYAVISTFTKRRSNPANIIVESMYMTLNVLAETAVGIILIVGLLSNTTFILAAQTFVGIKAALILPIILVAVYFFFKTEEGFDISIFKSRSISILKTNIPVWVFVSGVLALGAMAVLLARSGNFTIPVPGFEKAARELLEKVMFIRPRTKEFLIGYPMLMVAAYYFLKGKFKEWMPILLSIGVIGPISFLNTYCHIHSPVSVSIIRSLNGMVLGIVVGLIICFVIDKYSKK